MNLEKVKGTYLDASGTTVTYSTFARELITHPDGQATSGSISLNVVNLQFVLSIGSLSANGTGWSGYDLANISMLQMLQMEQQMVISITY